MDVSPAEMPIVELICPSRTDMLRFIRGIVSAMARELDFHPDDVSGIEAAVDEACTNVIRHAYDPIALTSATSPPPQMKVQIHLTPDRLAIRVTDEGKGLSSGGPRGISSIEEYALQAQPKGLGSYIISRFMDEVMYHSPPGSGTVLSMVKYRHRPHASSSTPSTRSHTPSQP